MTDPVRSEVPYDEIDRELTAIVSGWDGGFHTRPNNLHTSKRVIPITSEEILTQLRELKNLCNKDNLNRLYRIITKHAGDHTNPHQTDLSQFATDILHLLYTEYTMRGGVATYDTFLGILFEDYQIAGLDDIFDGTNPKLLTTVKLTARYIQQHNEDENAHLELFKKMFPGDPVLVEPGVAIMTMYEISGSFQKYRTDKLSYIGQDGYRHLSEFTYLPIDFTFGTPVVACFLDRTNKCKSSRDFTNTGVWGKQCLDVEFIPNAPCVNKNSFGPVGATLLKETTDSTYQEHILFLEDLHVLADTVSNYSFDILPLEAKYLCIRVVDKIFGTSQLAFINFNKETAFITTTDDTMYLRMIKLAEGYFRIEYSFYNERTRDIGVQIIPYISSTATPKYIGTGKLLAYIDNAQFEDDCIGCSPFIYTSGDEVTRHNARLEIPTDGWFNPDKGAFVFDIISPIPIKTGMKERTLYSFRNEDYPAMMGTYSGPNTFFARMYNESDVQIFNYPITATKEASRQLAFGYGLIDMNIATTGVAAKSITLITPRRKDEKVLHIGHDNGINPLDGYFKGFTFYKDEMSTENITFLAGE